MFIRKHFRQDGLSRTKIGTRNNTGEEIVLRTIPDTLSGASPIVARLQMTIAENEQGFLRARELLQALLTDVKQRLDSGDFFPRSSFPRTESTEACRGGE